MPFCIIQTSTHCQSRPKSAHALLDALKAEDLIDDNLSLKRHGHFRLFTGAARKGALQKARRWRTKAKTLKQELSHERGHMLSAPGPSGVGDNVTLHLCLVHLSMQSNTISKKKLQPVLLSHGSGSWSRQP